MIILVVALYLVQVPGIKIDLYGLLLGGIIIGALGVPDDLIITQASAVFELHEANTQLGFRQLYQRAYRIKQDHVPSTVNTLVMAYTGVALPLLLLFAVERGNYAQLISVASVAEDIVRTLVGSLGLVAAVPVSTLIAWESSAPIWDRKPMERFIRIHTDKNGLLRFPANPGSLRRPRTEPGNVHRSQNRFVSLLQSIDHPEYKYPHPPHDGTSGT